MIMLVTAYKWITVQTITPSDCSVSIKYWFVENVLSFHQKVKEILYFIGVQKEEKVYEIIWYNLLCTQNHITMCHIKKNNF